VLGRGAENQAKEADMTPRERVLATLRREAEVYPVPFEFGTTPAFAQALAERIGTHLFADYFEFEMRGVGWGPPKVRPDFSRYFAEHGPGANIHIGEWGDAVEPGTFYHFTHKVYPMERLTTLREFEEYPYPDLEEASRHAHLDQAASDIKARGFAAVAGMECTIFETAWYMRGMENLFFDHLERRELAAYLLDRITERKAFMARRYAEAGVDVIRFGDDIGTQRAPLMSVGMWREWYKPRFARVIDAAKSVKRDLIAFYHSDGNYEAFIPDLLDIGINVLNPIQPECMDPVALKRTYGDRAAFWGTIGIQTTMPFGGVEDVRREVRERIRTVGKGGGLVLAPTHVLEPEVPVDNLLALADETRRFRP
jgi:uroporphyrinogen decarboxylase